jgi:biopolymer transport protein ExbB
MDTQIKDKRGFLNSSWFSLVIIGLCMLMGIFIYFKVLGMESNFLDGATKHKPANYLGMMFMGGYIVPFLISFFLMTLVFSIERGITIFRAFGNGSSANFVHNVKLHLIKNELNEAEELCQKQQGSIGNVVYSGLLKFKVLKADNTMNRDEKAESLQKEIEEAAMLEMPALQKNLNVLATLASVATLIGLLGTVVGMIKAFAALATAGSPDSQALATGISEALFNTALGILTSALANVAYNYLTTKIDELTTMMEEVGFAMQQVFKK